jgi:hypothetical protein
MNQESFQSLVQALKLSPDNAPLRGLALDAPEALTKASTSSGLGAVPLPSMVRICPTDRLAGKWYAHCLPHKIRPHAESNWTNSVVKYYFKFHRLNAPVYAGGWALTTRSASLRCASKRLSQSDNRP